MEEEQKESQEDEGNVPREAFLVHEPNHRSYGEEEEHPYSGDKRWAREIVEKFPIAVREIRIFAPHTRVKGYVKGGKDEAVEGHHPVKVKLQKHK